MKIGNRHPCETARKPPYIVLLGSTGFVGSAVQAQLEETAYRVICVSNDPRVDRVLDLSSAPDLTSAIPQGAVVVNLAYMWHAGESANRAISRNIAEACTQAGAARLVHCSPAARRAQKFPEVSGMGRLLEDRLVELRVRQQPLQPRVLLLERLQALRLVDLHPSVFLAPAEGRGIRNPTQLAHRRHRAPPGELDIRLPELVDDLLRRETLTRYDLTS